MEAFTTLKAIACPLGLANVDTDQLIAARFMKTPRKAGYGKFLLHDLRFGETGAPKPDFVLGQPRYANAKILVARRNFGTGSSREAAVYALWDFGIRCVIAPSFGDIFASNAVKNGLLPARIADADVENLLAWLADAPRPELVVDLVAQTIEADRMTLSFTIDPTRRDQLVNGWDDIDMTERYRVEIDRFRQQRLAAAPWAFPGAR